MALKTEGNVGMDSHRIEGQAQESNPGGVPGGVEAEKPDVILPSINPRITKGLPYG